MLTKKDKKKRYNKNVKSKGHSFAGTWTQLTRDAFTESPGSAISGVASAAAGAISTGIDAAKLQGVEEAQAGIDKQAAFQSTASTQDDLLAEMTGAGNIKSDYNHKDFMQSGGDFAKSMVSGALQGAASGASAGPWGAVAGAAASLISGAIGRGAVSAKAEVEAAEKNQAAKEANQAKAQALTAKAGALDQAADARSLAAYYAEGGQINPFPSSEFGSPITEFNAGGTHEENPYDGIPQGIAPDGLPNLVEEGEVKFDNYIFSDRLMLTKEDKKKYKFLKGKTYADAAKAIKKQLGVDERPNDLLAKTDLEEQLSLLSMLQEEERQGRGLRGENRMMYNNGGHIFNGLSPVTIDENNVNADLRALEEYANASLDMELARQKMGQLPKIKTKNSFDWSSTLQAAPALGSAIGTMTSLFDKPPYEHTKRLTQSEEAVTPITYTPTHQDIRLSSLDKNFYMNKADAQAAATRRAIREQTASNPYASTLHLLVADAQGNVTRGDIRRQGEEMEINRILQEAQFNSTGRRADAEGLLKVAPANATLQDKARSRQAEKDAMAARLNMAEDQAWDAAKSANMTSLFDNLGAMGKEDQEFALAALKIFGEGKVTPEMQRMMLPRLQKILAKAGYKYGGKLRKKKGYTI